MVKKVRRGRVTLNTTFFLALWDMLFVQVQVHAWYIILFYLIILFPLLKRLHENPKSLLYWGVPRCSVHHHTATIPILNLQSSISSWSLVSIHPSIHAQSAHSASIFSSSFVFWFDVTWFYVCSIPPHSISSSPNAATARSNWSWYVLTAGSSTSSFSIKFASPTLFFISFPQKLPLQQRPPHIFLLHGCTQPTMRTTMSSTSNLLFIL